MAISKTGNVNDLRGKVGTVVLYELNEQFVGRSLPIRNAPYTEGELANQNKYRILNEFLSRVKGAYLIGFELVAKGTRSNAYNKAVSWNYAAVCGERGAQYFDYTKSAISEGKLPMAKDVTVALTLEGIHFTWNPESDGKHTFSDDQVMILIYFPKTGGRAFIKAGAKRSEGMELLVINTAKPRQAHIYLSFISNDRKSISNSQYLGELDFGTDHL